RQVLRRRHHAQAEAAGEAEGGQEADEDGRPRRGPPGGLRGRALHQRVHRLQEVTRGRLDAVCVSGSDLLPLPGRRPDRSGIDKRPVAGRVAVHPLGLDGDVQVHRRYHGGEGQAVYAYAREDADWWAAELGRELPPGRFGENLRTTGLDVTGAVIGEQWRVGGALFEVTARRIPCA